jgi:uncharacterized protein with GYD domain
MNRYVTLIKFTEKGVAAVKESPARAQRFSERAAKAGARIEAEYWTLGPYDGVLIFQAPDEATAAGLVLGLSRDGAVSTCMLRAFDAKEFGEVVAKMG